MIIKILLFEAENNTQILLIHFASNRPFACRIGSDDHVNSKNRRQCKMVARNGKNMMKLVKLSILRPLLLKREISWQFESSKILSLCMAGWQLVSY